MLSAIGRADELRLDEYLFFLRFASKKITSRIAAAAATPTERPTICAVPNSLLLLSSSSWLSSRDGDSSAVGAGLEDEPDVAVSVDVGSARLVEVVKLDVVGEAVVDVVDGVDDLEETRVEGGGARTTPPAVPVTTKVASSAVWVGRTAPGCPEHMKYALSISSECILANVRSSLEVARALTVTCQATSTQSY